MHVKDVREVLAAGGLTLRPLTVLRPTRDPYRALLYQPGGTLRMSSAGVSNAAADDATAACRAVLAEAVSTLAQLVVAPEYCVPWVAVADVLQGAARPADGALWILGCESISPDELDRIAAEWNQQAGVRVIHEPLDATERAQRRFIDPVVLLFWADAADGQPVLCLLVQFKTAPSRDPLRLELQHMYRGRVIYRLRCSEYEISLLTLVCADSIEFQNYVTDHCADVLFVHVELNEKPGHPAFAAYRRRIVDAASNQRVEVLCVNWAAGVKTHGVDKPFSLIAGSGWYLLPEGAELTDEAVRSLHDQGLYFSFVNRRWLGFFLGYFPQVMLVAKQPVFSLGEQVLAPRIPPAVVSIKSWRSEVSALQAEGAQDGFNSFVANYAPLGDALRDLYAQDPLAVERAIELLAGPRGKLGRWYELDALLPLHVDDEESLRRFTVSQETDDSRGGVRFREARARNAQAAVQLASAWNWPHPFGDLGAGFRFRWKHADPHSNVEPLAGGEPAALIYLGDNPEKPLLENLYAWLRFERQKKALERAGAGATPSDLDAERLRAEDRICVVCRTSHVLQVFRPTTWPSISDPKDAQRDDLAAEG